ncbi:MAG: type III-B CRISPR module-associated protein Cmr3, partial [Candidatus Thiodiazotropha sp. (ex Lucinoma borealis)]|nr:type III-B CRISPR module-associated protein Cmr3 [Candidatus Thiodiazotropha sp. (ex Lucinoma borealis)]
MSEYLIRPKAPLLFRNAKPFASGEGGAETLPFPSPATISGAMRTAWAEQQKQGQGLEYTKENAELLRKKQVLGPLLVSEKPGCTQLLMLTPRDSLCLDNMKGERIIYRIAPEQLGEGEGCDLPNESLLPLHLQTNDSNKPSADAPAFWYL